MITQTHKVAKLKGFKGGQTYMLLETPITKDFSLKDFQDIRIVYIEALKFDFDSFETSVN